MKYGFLRDIRRGWVALFAVALALFTFGFWHGLQRESRLLAASGGAADCPVEGPAPDCFTTVEGVVVDFIVTSSTTGNVYHIAIDPRRAPATTTYFGAAGNLVVEPRAGGRLREGQQVSVVLYDDRVFEVVTEDGDRIRSGQAAEFRLLPLLFVMTAGSAALTVASGAYLVARLRRRERHSDDERCAAEYLAFRLAWWVFAAGVAGGLVMFVAQQFDLVAARRLVPLAVGVTLGGAAALAGFLWRREVTVR